MPSVAAMGTSPPLCGAAMRSFPRNVKDGPRCVVEAGKSAPEPGKVHDPVTDSNFIGYEELSVADQFGGYQSIKAEVTSVGRRRLWISADDQRSRVARSAPRMWESALELFPRRRVMAVDQLDAAQSQRRPTSDV